MYLSVIRMFQRVQNHTLWGSQTFGSKTAAEMKECRVAAQGTAQQGPCSPSRWFRSGPEQWSPAALSGEHGVIPRESRVLQKMRWVEPPLTTSPAAQIIFSLRGKAMGWETSGLRETWGGLGKCQSGVGKLSLPASHVKCNVSIVDAWVSISVPWRGCCTALSSRQGEKQRNCSFPPIPASHPQVT